MRRLLCICAVAEPGGAEVGLVRLLRRLGDRGWAPTVTSPAPGGVRQAVLAHGWAWEPLDAGGLPRGAGLRAAGSMPRARRLARAADAVYLNGGVPGRLLPALRGSRTVLHVHDLVDRVPRHWRAADVVLADSQAVADRLAGLDARVVFCPVELDPPAVWPPWDADDRPVVGFVGRIEPRKGALDLARAAPAIRAARPDVRVMVVGDDPYRSDPGYLKAVRACPDVEHHGWVPDAAGLMRHLDVLVAPSLQEPFGTVLAEAMAVGTPVVATRVGGLAEVVDDGVTGRLVAPGDPPALARAVLEVLERHEALGAAARVRAQRFGADAYADRVEALLPALRGARTVLHVHDLVDRVPRHWRAAGVVLADSQAVADRLTGIDAHVVFCPVELDPPAVWPPWDADDRPVVGFVGRIEPRKGVLDLARAAPAIRAARPDVRVVVVGDDPYRSDPGYVQAVRACPDVEHHGWVPDAAGLMRHLAVLVAPSRQEPFGTVLAEAMAVGTPVVATRVGGLAEVVDDGVTGRLVAPGDPAALARAVLEVLDRRDAMGAAARVHAQRFGADAYADRVEALLPA